MFNLTTPKAILLGLIIIAGSIASLPYSSNMLIRDAQAEIDNYDLSNIEYGLSGIATELEYIYKAIGRIDISCG